MSSLRKIVTGFWKPVDQVSKGKMSFEFGFAQFTARQGIFLAVISVPEFVSPHGLLQAVGWKGEKLLQ